jgi:hypothetical protein
MLGCVLLCKAESTGISVLHHRILYVPLNTPPDAFYNVLQEQSLARIGHCLLVIYIISVGHQDMSNTAHVIVIL